MHSPGEAARAILAAIRPLPPEPVPLADALDLVLAEDVVSPIDLPPWDNSAMDGYAVRATDVVGARAGGQEGRRAGGPAPPTASRQPPTLQVIETIPAGGFPTRPIGPGQCARIFTGAPLPDGADGVIRQEDTTPLDGQRVRIDDGRDAGKNVRYRGEDLGKGSVALGAGTPLGPAQLGVLASIGLGQAPAHRRPVVAFLGSGDEIVDLDRADEVLAGRKIASSNTYTLLGMIRRAGAVPLNLGIARDDPADIRHRLQSLVRRAGGPADRRSDSSPSTADLLVTTAGISVGEHDHLRAVFAELGGTLDFWRISMRPGAPVGFGTLHGVPWLGLPGNPVSAMVTFELFVRPAIRKLLGHATFFRRTVPVRVAQRLHYPPRLTHFLRAVVTERNGGLEARLTGPQGSGILTSMARANALLVVPAERDDVEVGETLAAVLLDEPGHTVEPAFE
jgi:molybdopterin molybdotransferase